MGNNDSKLETKGKTDLVVGEVLTFKDYTDACEKINSSMLLLKMPPRSSIPFNAMVQTQKLLKNLTELTSVWGLANESLPVLKDASVGTETNVTMSEPTVKQSKQVPPKSSSQEQKKLECEICSIRLPDHIQTKKHIESQQHIISATPIKEFIMAEGEILGASVFCKLCSQPISLSKIEKHVKTQNHNRRMETNTCPKSESQLPDSSFERNGIELDEFMTQVEVMHLEEKLNRNDVVHFCGLCKFATMSEEKWNSHVLCTHSSTPSYETFPCHTCKILVGGESKFSQLHFKSESHKRLESVYSKNLGSSTESSTQQSDSNNKRNRRKNDKKQTKAPNEPDIVAIISGLDPGTSRMDVEKELSYFGRVKKLEMEGMGKARVVFYHERRVQQYFDEISRSNTSIMINDRAVTVTLQQSKKGIKKGQFQVQSFKEFKQQIESLLEEMNRAEENSAWNKINQDLIKVTGSEYKICLYGSRVTNLAREYSNYNIFIEGPKYVNIIEALKSKIGASSSFQNVECDIVSARTYILKFLHASTNSKCVVFGESPSGVQNTNLVKAFMAIDWRVRWMLAAIKFWSRQNKLQGKGGIDPNSIIWLMLFYLMQRKPTPLLPPAKLILENSGNSDIVKWKNANKVDENTLPQDLLIGFFGYYRDLDFTQNALHPLTGNTATNVKGTHMQLEDPIETRYNITHKVTIAYVNKFQVLCKDFEKFYS